MSKTQNAQIAYQLISITIVIILLLSLNTLFLNPIVSASPEASRWTRVNIPAEGAAGGWVLADGSDIQRLTVSVDGTLYAYGKGLTYTLYKSTDGGLKWSYIGNVQDAITDIAVSPQDTNTIYYATVSAVFRSTNGGKSFLQMPASPGGAGAGNIEITSIAATWLNNNIIAVSTRDTDNSEFGGVYILDEADIIPDWIDSGISSYDVYAVAFSPNYVADRQIVAVATDETDTIVVNKIGNADWNAFIGSARLDRDNSRIPTAVAVADTAEIAFPGNYNADTGSANSFFFIGIDTGAGEGDVFKINCIDAPGNSAATDLNIGSAYGENNTDITGLTLYSDERSAILLAGAADSSRTYVSTDGGTSWTRCRKEPTGGSDTCVLMAPDFATTGMMYAATSGNGSALSISRDIGISWNQISLIDTAISTIVDFVPSPVDSQSNAIFLITSGGEDSLWRSTDDGSTWERVLSGYSSGVDTLALVSLPPQYGIDCQTVFVAGESNGNPSIWESKDNGQTFRCRGTRDPATGTAFSIDVWTVTDENTLYIGSFNGSQGIIHGTTNSGFTYSEGAPAGTDSFYSIAFLPDGENGGTILTGNYDGWVYLSSDNGTSFQPLPVDAALPPLVGSISVAFDPDFNTNHTVYAASDNVDSGIYRFIIGRSEEWESIDDTLPAGAKINRLAVSGSGILYAANSKADGGMERSLNAKSASGSTFETVTLGLSDGAALSNLWQSNRRLWSIDDINLRLMTYFDTLVSPPVNVSPENEISGIGSLIDHTIRNITIDWETIEGATSYEWQCKPDTDFSSIPTGFEDTTSASSVRLPALEPATTYYWRMRASAPALGPWSPKWSFTTSMDTEGVSLKPETPSAGAAGVSVKPVFQWTAVIGAEAYELLVSTDTDFNHPAIVRINEFALKTNAWECDVSLNYATTYYWKVRATTASTSSAWSSAGVFTTESAPVTDDAPSTLTPAPTQLVENTLATLTPSKNVFTLPAALSPEEFRLLPTSIPTQSPVQTTIVSQLPDMPNWIIYLIGGLLAIVFLALFIVLVIVLKIKRF